LFDVVITAIGHVVVNFPAAAFAHILVLMTTVAHFIKTRVLFAHLGV